jgi:hypothetical protein
MAAITFTDGTGTATLDNGLTATAGGVGSRFASWVPFTRRIGERAVALGTGASYSFTFRIDYGAAFEMRDIPNTNQGTILRLIRHLEGGGTITVTTGDSASRTYTNCSIDPETAPSLAFQDAQFLTYSLSLSVINLAGADMLCTYD